MYDFFNGQFISSNYPIRPNYKTSTSRINQKMVDSQQTGTNIDSFATTLIKGDLIWMSTNTIIFFKRHF